MYEVLGAVGEPAIVVRVRNIEEVVRNAGGTLAALARWAAPNTIAGEVYKTIQGTLLTEFKKQGVDAEVSVVTSPPTGKTGRSEFLTGAATGVVATVAVGGAGWLVWKYVLSRFLGGR